MSDLTAREASSQEWDQPVVELVEDGRVVGYVYVDSEVAFAEFLADEDGDAWAFEVSDLQNALDTARAMLLPEGTEALLDTPTPSDDTHPVDRLAAEIDALAAHRGAEDEGFFPPRVAAQIIQRCEQIDLAVVGIEGFRLLGGEPSPIAGMSVDTGNAHDGEPWPVFKAGCNVQAMGVLERWVRDPDVIIALEVGDDEGERYVL